MRYLAYSDVFSGLEEFCRGHGSGQPGEAIRLAILDAYDEVGGAWNWTWLEDVFRLHLNESQDDGTVDYVHSTKKLTLSDSTWPSWVGKGSSLYLNDLVCDVESRDSDTELTLDDDRNPGEDLSGESYTVFERWIELPDDFVSTKAPMAESFYRFGTPSSLDEIERMHRWRPTTGEITHYAVGRNPDAAMAFHPYPASNGLATADIVYAKRPRALRFCGHLPDHYAGTITVAGTAVTGSGTAWTSAMVGSLLRISANANQPTGLEGANPYLEEIIISAVGGAESLTLADSGTTAEAVRARVTDPVDLGRCAWTLLRRTAERNLGRARGVGDARLQAAVARDAFLEARGANNPNRAVETAGGQRAVSTRLSRRYNP